MKKSCFVRIGNCIETSNTSFICNCSSGWTGEHCELKENFCANVSCLNNGVCHPMFKNYSCECLKSSYSGRHCEIVESRLQTLKATSQSFSIVVIIFLLSIAGFIMTMDILSYCFGINPTKTDLDFVRRRQGVKSSKKVEQTPIVQRFVYVA